MVQRFTLFVLVLSQFQLLFAQETSFVEITQGPGYAREVYYNLASQEAVAVDGNAWDIAFSGGFSAGIWLNETSDGSGTTLGLYRLSADYSYTDTLAPDMAEERLFNKHTGYGDGAFAQVADPANPFDLGWGEYNPVNHTVANGPAFLLQKRDSSWVKFRVNTLASGTFSFSYADLDGANETIDTIDTRAYPDRSLIHYSMQTKAVVTNIPSEWDLIFTRYYTPLDDGQGGTLDYLVTGSLQGPGIEVAEVQTLDPDQRAFQAGTDTFSSNLDVIGYDWKSFDLSTFSYSIADDVVYFVKDRQDKLWKLQFIDFEGSSTGVSVFFQAEAGIISSTTDQQLAAFVQLNAYPNPVVDQVTVQWKDENRLLDQASWQLMSASGDLLRQGALRNVPTGTLELSLENMPVGTYFFQVRAGQGILTKPLLKQ
jgi:hypothetical protein